MSIVVRSTEPHEFRQAANAFSVALLNAPPSDQQWEHSLSSWKEQPSFSAWDGDVCVGHGSHHIVATTVPGGARLSTSAVTRIGVLPTHRRLGIGTRLMSELLDDARQRDLTLMSLRASEATIYARYGFGVAGDYCNAAIDPIRVRPVAGASTAGSFRILDSNEIVDVVAALYDRIAHRRPGVVTRPLPWVTRMFRSAVEHSEPSFVVVHLDAGREPDGYVHYHVKWSEAMNSGPTGWGDVHDLFGATDAIELALWQYLLDIDLVTRWTAIGRPTDDLVMLAARDRRGYQQAAVQDEQWLRLVDVDTALRRRTYRGAAGSVSIQVTDPVIPGNNGAWRVSAEGAERTDDPPDLSVGIETISAAYLGGPSWTALTGTGAVDVRNPEAVTLADTLFASRPLPHCGTFF